jgi:hypothetical protein
MTDTTDSYHCFHCEKPTTSIRAIPIMDEKEEDRWEMLCEDCYEEWLHSLKG